MALTMRLHRAPRALAVLVAAAAVTLSGAALPPPASAADGDSPDAPVVLSPSDGSQLSGTITIRAAWTTNPYPYPTKVGVVTHQYRADGSYATYNVVHSDQVNGVEARWTPPTPGRWGVQAFRCDARVVCMSSSVERDRSREVFFTYSTTSTSPTATPTSAAPTTPAPTTPAPTTPAPTTPAPTTPAPATPAPTSAAPTTPATSAPPTSTSPSPTPTPAGPPLSVQAPDRVVRGSEVLVSGRAAPGARVAVHLLREGAASPDVTSLLADDDGTWQTTYSADTDRTVWATSGGGRSADTVVRAVGTTLGRLGLVRTGTTVQIGGLARPGVAVDVWARDRGTTAATLRRTVLAGSDGRWSTPWSPATDQVVHAASTEGQTPPQLLQIALATLSGPATAFRGSTVTLSGRARPGAVVTVAFRRTGTTTFVVRRTVRADGAGRFRTTWTADVSQAWYAQADGVRSAVGATTVRVPAAGSACSPTAPLFSYVDSARCLYRAYVRKDSRLAAHYAAAPVARELLTWHGPGYVPAWTFSGCGPSEVAPSSSGVSCFFYDPDGASEVHGLGIELGMSRSYRVESLETVG